MNSAMVRNVQSYLTSFYPIINCSFNQNRPNCMKQTPKQQNEVIANLRTRYKLVENKLNQVRSVLPPLALCSPSMSYSSPNRSIYSLYSTYDSGGSL